MKLNLVMIVKNEERTLEKCLEAAKPLVDEMIIADTGSDDSSREIALRMGAKVFEFPWTGDFSAARNFALSHSDADWNLVLDADEILRPCSRAEIESLVRKHGERWMGGMLLYNSYREGEEIRVSVDAIPRLFPQGVRYKGIIHEQPDVSWKCFPTPLAVDHDGYLYTDKGERNLPYLKRIVEQEPENDYYQFQLAYTLRNLKRTQEALEHFRKFYQLSPREKEYRGQGIVLYLYTLMDAGDGKTLAEALEVIQREDSALKGLADFMFVCGLFYMKLVLSDVRKYLKYLPKIQECYLRCLEIGEQPWSRGVVGTGSFLANYNLGVWYEVSGQIEQAICCYRAASEEGYEPAHRRMENLEKKF